MEDNTHRFIKWHTKYIIWNLESPYTWTSHKLYNMPFVSCYKVSNISTFIFLNYDLCVPFRFCYELPFLDYILTATEFESIRPHFLQIVHVKLRPKSNLICFLYVCEKLCDVFQMYLLSLIQQRATQQNPKTSPQKKENLSLKSKSSLPVI